MDFVYNPDAMSEAEVKANFVGRGALLNELLDLVHSQPDGAGVQHAVVISPRGMGKTMLLQRFRYAVLESNLATVWFPLKFPEELYGVVDIADFWLETLRFLSAETREPEWAAQITTLTAEFRSRTDLAAAALSVLKDFRRHIGKRLLLLVENLDSVFKILSDEGDNARLRETLMNDGDFMFIGSAVSFFAQARGYDQPLYNFFRIFNLNPLSFEESTQMLTCRSKDQNQFNEKLLEDSARLRTLHYFTQGIPRLVVMLHQVLAQSDVSGVRQALEKLLDGVTPYYKARVEILPAQQSKILDYVARHAAKTNEGISPKQLAADVGIPANQISTQLKRLVEGSYLRSVPLRGREACYVLSEPLYALWHQMRLNPETRTRKLSWLVDFLHNWFNDEERIAEAERLFSKFNEYKQAKDDTRALAQVEHLSLLAESAIKTSVVGKVFLKSIRALNIAQQVQLKPSEITEMLINQHEYLEAALKENPKDAKCWLAKGNYLSWEAKNYKEALVCFDRALELNSEDAETWHSSGIALWFQERYGEAIAALKQAVGMDPRYSKAWADLGIMLTALERYKEAVAALNQAVEIETNDPQYWHCLGDAYSALGQCRDAIDSFNRVLQINPTDSMALFFRNGSIKDLERYTRAVTILDGAFVLNVHHPLRDSNQINLLLMLEEGFSKVISLNLLDHAREYLILAAKYKHYALVRELIETLDQKDDFFVVDRAVEYLQTEEKSLLEKLSPEVKEAVKLVVDSLRSPLQSQVQG